MLAVPARLVLAAALATGSALALPASATAAARPSCLIGKWKLTKYKMDSTVQGAKATAQGGAGARLTVTKKTVSYTFTGSKKVITTGINGEQPYTKVDVYKKRLTFKSTLNGVKKGDLTLKVASAAGDATLSTKWNGVSLGTSKLAKTYRKGQMEPFVPPYARYTCTSKALKLQFEAGGGDSTVVSVLSYKRV